MKLHTAEDVRLVVPKAALAVIFDECDTFEHDETGGRVIGTFEEHGGKLTLQISGIIESGPHARRTRVSFFQDGEHQERIFRQIEHSHPEIEHLGNWHTHHVNGLPTLSGGDVSTYQRTVNHHNHNTSFFYALLVVARRKTRNPHQRYEIRHYIFRRDDEHIYEIPPRMVEIVDSPLLWPSVPAHYTKHRNHTAPDEFGVLPERVYDRDILCEFYQGVHPFASKKLGLYWRGPIELLDSSSVEVVVVEDSSARVPIYSIVLRDPPDALRTVAEQLAKREFPSARAAVILTERSCNRLLYEQRVNLREITPSI